jgi:hypothetical protein
MYALMMLSIFLKMMKIDRNVSELWQIVRKNINFNIFNNDTL